MKKTLKQAFLAPNACLPGGGCAACVEAQHTSEHFSRNDLLYAAGTAGVLRKNPPNALAFGGFLSPGNNSAKCAKNVAQEGGGILCIQKPLLTF